MMQASIIANCVFNAFFGFTAITFNIVTILALRKPLTIPRAVKTLLMSLAVADLGVGLLVQPLYVAYLVMLKQENTQNSTFEIVSDLWGNTAYFFTYASFFGVVALAADRFLAIHLHLRYQELVTHKRVVAVVIFIWILSAILTILIGRTPNVEAFIVITVDSVCYLTTAWFYFKIYLTVRHHSNQIHVLQEQLAQNNGTDMGNAERERKAAVGTFYVYVVFLICCLIGPHTVLTNLELYTEMLTYLNSSLNPLIYSWKMKHVRHAIMEILRNILPYPHN
ncbi:adenosine receptor A3-like [Porites lutea]|uniref:adenosine receptor A3-like n=1 Tax=Porites lutea TaxID=51062 RepID=UPI003CC590CE